MVRRWPIPPNRPHLLLAPRSRRNLLTPMPIVDARRDAIRKQPLLPPAQNLFDSVKSLSIQCCGHRIHANGRRASPKFAMLAIMN